MNKLFKSCSIIWFILFTSIITNAFGLEMCSGEEATLSCLKKNFEKLYTSNHATFSSILEKYEKKAMSCKNYKNTAEFLELANINSQNAEFNEYYSEVIEKLLFSSSNCFFESLTKLDESSQKKVINEIKQATFHDIESINKIFNKYRNNRRYKGITHIYFKKE